VVRRALERFGIPVLGALPLLGLSIAFLTDRLGADPVEKLLHETGEWALRFLILTLLVTPLRRWSGWSGLAPHRRTLGLYSFFYALLHFTTYLVFDLGLDFGFLQEDILERPYITVGFTSFLILLALALTSTKAAMKRLKRRWNTLHRAAYVAATLAIVHYVWLVKADLQEPLVYGAVVFGLLAARIPRARHQRS